MDRLIWHFAFALCGFTLVDAVLLCGGVLSPDLVGGDLTVLGCKDCKMKSKDDIWECEHPNTAGAPCNNMICLHSYVTWWACVERTEIFDKGKCETKTDPAIIYRTQRSYTVTEALNCVDEGWKKIPGGDGTSCNQIGYGAADPTKAFLKGKCFLTAAEITRCKAGTISDDWFFQGSEVCK